MGTGTNSISSHSTTGNSIRPDVGNHEFGAQADGKIASATVIVVDTSIEGFEALLDGVSPDAELIFLSPGEGIAGLVDKLAGYSNIQSLQILSHGDVGELNLAGDTISAATLATNSDAFNAIGQAMATDGDILLYGCRIGESAEGLEFIQALASATGADVAASDDLTGNAQLGGDWDLEVSSGKIDFAGGFSGAATDFSATLGPAAGTITFSDLGEIAGTFASPVQDPSATDVDSSGLDAALNTTGGDGGVIQATTSPFAGDAVDNASDSSLQFHASPGTTLDDVRLTSTDGAEFQLDSMVVGLVTSATATVTILGFRDGAQVASLTYSTSTNTTGVAVDGHRTVTFDSDWENIDEIRISASGAEVASIAVDDIVVAAAAGDTNTAPTIAGAPSDLIVTEDASSNIDLSAITVADDDADTLTLTLSVDVGTFSTPADGAAVGDGVTATLVNGTTVTLSGSAADINSYLDTASNITYTGEENASGDNQATLTLTPNDGTEDGTATTVNIDITEVNDAPTDVTLSGSLAVTETMQGSVVGTISVSDVDDTSWTYTVSDDRFSVNGDNELILNNDASLNNETEASIELTITVMDDDGASATLDVTLTVYEGGAILGTPQDDTLTGTSGDDLIFGLAENDSIAGLAGNDTLNGGSGNDTLNGEAGSDTLIGAAGNDALNGGDGTDTASYASAAAAVIANLATGMTSDDGDGGTDTLSAIENIVGSAFADTLEGDANANRLFGGRGADSLIGGAGADTLTGGAGDDIAQGGDGDDFFFAGTNVSSDDTVNGGNGDDLIGTKKGDDLLEGGYGNDTLFGGDGNDTLYAGSQTDQNSDDANDALWASNGNDKLFGGLGADVLGGGKDADLINGNDGNDTIYGGSGDFADTVNGDQGDDLVFSGAGNDIITGGLGGDVLFGGSNNDSIDGGDGADEIYGGSGTDTIVGGDGIDTLRGGNGQDDLSGDAGNDKLFGQGGNDDLDGGANNDTLFGGDGADTLAGGAGDDELSGGAGEDTFVFENGSGNDTITDFSLTDDTLDLSASATDFANAAAVQDAATETTQDSQSGVLIDLGGGDSVFVVGISITDLTDSIIMI